MTIRVAVSYQKAAELDEAVAAALLSWGMALADTKHRMGLRTSEWVTGGPTLEAAVGAAAITQDELGHARSLYAIWRDFPGAPEGIGAENDLQARQSYRSPRLLNHPWSSWLDVIAVNVLLDRVTSIAVAAAHTSAFGPLRGRVGKILQEEAFHRIFGDSWLAKLARTSDPLRERLQASIDHFWPTAVGWFGPDDDAISWQLLNAQLLHATPANMRRQWLAEVTALLVPNGLRVPAGSIDWAGWNAACREVA